MPSTAYLFGKGAQASVTGGIDWDTDSFHMLCATSAWTPNVDTDDFRNDVTELAAGSGYSAGGVALTGVAVTYDSATHQVRFDCTDPMFPFSGAKTFRYLPVCKWRGGASSADELFGNVDLGADNTFSVPVTFGVDPTGLFYIDVA